MLLVDDGTDVATGNIAIGCIGGGTSTNGSSTSSPFEWFEGLQTSLEEFLLPTFSDVDKTDWDSCNVNFIRSLKKIIRTLDPYTNLELVLGCLLLEDCGMARTTRLVQLSLGKFPDVWKPFSVNKLLFVIQQYTQNIVEMIWLYSPTESLLFAHRRRTSCTSDRVNITCFCKETNWGLWLSSV